MRSPPARTVVLEKGHIDTVAAHHEDGALHLHVHDETVDPSDVVPRVLPGAGTTVPDGPAYGFPGAPVWTLPEAQDPELLWTRTVH